MASVVVGFTHEEYTHTIYTGQKGLTTPKRNLDRLDDPSFKC